MTASDAHGRCALRLDEVEVEILRQVFGELSALIGQGPHPADPALGRLFPDAYPDDPDSSAELRRYTDGELRASKVDAAGVVLASLPAGGGMVRLDDEQAEAWLRSLTDARLALGTRLGIEANTDLQEEMDEAVLADPTSPWVQQLSVYGFLTVLQGSLVEALTT